MDNIGRVVKLKLHNNLTPSIATIPLDNFLFCSIIMKQSDSYFRVTSPKDFLWGVTDGYTEKSVCLPCLERKVARVSEPFLFERVLF